MTKVATAAVPLGLVALVLYLMMSAVAVAPREVVNVPEPALPAIRTVRDAGQVEAPVAPALDEIAWGEHAWTSHGADADRAIENLTVCENPHAYFCGGPETRDTVYIYVCQFPGAPDKCAGAIVGRLARGFTAYPSTCAWWFGKVEGCTPVGMAGR